MINRNLKAIMLGFLFNSQASNEESIKFSDINTYKTDGSQFLCPDTDGDGRRTEVSNAIVNALNNPTTTNAISQQNINRLYMAVGTGTTEATEKDYTLESENTNITCETIAQNYTQSYKRQITATFNNPTAQEITLKEVGLFEEYYVDESNCANWLLARENIDVTIPAGESKAITMEIG